MAEVGWRQERSLRGDAGDTSLMGTFVQAPAVLDTSGTSAAFASITVGAGNLLVVGVRLGGNVTVTISDDKSNTWALADGQQNTPLGGDSHYVYYAKNAASGATVVTVTPSSSVSIRGSLFEISGEDTSTPLDQHTHAAGTSTALASGNVTSTSAGMWIGFGVDESLAPVFTAGTCGSATGTIPVVGGASTKSAMEYHNEASTVTNGSANETITLSDPWWMAVVNFKDAGGASGGGPLIRGGELTHGVLTRGGRLTA